MDGTVVPLDVVRMFAGDAPILIYLEILLRVVIVYTYTLVLLRWIGSRTIAQLSTVEFLLVIALGSAVGDSMFYPDVPLLHALLVVTLVILINKGVDMLLYRSETMKTAIDGSAIEVVRNGRISAEGLADRNMSVGELQELLRLNGATNLGEIALAYIEASGQMSVFTLAKPRIGLPLIPVRNTPGENAISAATEFRPGDNYACTHCGITGAPPPTSSLGCCDCCGQQAWVPACIGPADKSIGAVKRLSAKRTGKPQKRQAAGISPLPKQSRA